MGGVALGWLGRPAVKPSVAVVQAAVSAAAAAPGARQRLWPMHGRQGANRPALACGRRRRGSRWPQQQKQRAALCWGRGEPPAASAAVDGCATSLVFLPMQPSQKRFIIKKKLARKARQNRPIPPWIRFRTGNTIRCVPPLTRAGGSARAAAQTWVDPGHFCTEQAVHQRGNGSLGHDAGSRSLWHTWRVPQPAHQLYAATCWQVEHTFQAAVVESLPMFAPPWFCSYNAKRRHWRRTKLGI